MWVVLGRFYDFECFDCAGGNCVVGNVGRWIGTLGQLASSELCVFVIFGRGRSALIILFL